MPCQAGKLNWRAGELIAYLVRPYLSRYSLQSYIMNLRLLWYILHHICRTSSEINLNFYQRIRRRSRRRRRKEKKEKEGRKEKRTSIKRVSGLFVQKKFKLILRRLRSERIFFKIYHDILLILFFLLSYPFLSFSLSICYSIFYLL